MATRIISLPLSIAAARDEDVVSRPPNDWFTRAKVSVVIPTLNEAKNLPHVLPLIPAGVHEVIIVDGHSQDNTVEVAQRLHPDVRVIYESRRGKGAAMKTGFAEATGNIIVSMDADGSMNPMEIPAYVGALVSGAEYAKGSRFMQGGATTDMGAFRYWGNWVFRTAVNVSFGGRFSDLCYGYNAFWKDVLPLLEVDADGFEVETVMNINALKAGLDVVEVASHETERIHGVSHLRSFPDGWRILKSIVLMRVKMGFNRRRGTLPRPTASPYPRRLPPLDYCLPAGAERSGTSPVRKNAWNGNGRGQANGIVPAMTDGMPLAAIAETQSMPALTESPELPWLEPSASEPSRS